jgi:hypothetical protein
MIDPAAQENWIDAPYPSSTSTDPPDEIDESLGALADAIRKADGGKRQSLASCLAREPALSKIASVLSRLPSSRLIAFLERNGAGPSSSVTNSLAPGIAASGAADRMAQAQLFRRITMPARMYALERACRSAAAEGAGANA